MKLSITHEDGFSIVSILETRLDASLAPDFKAQMEDIISNENHNIILDISKLNFMDSSSLGAMVAVYKTLGSKGKLVIFGASGVVLDLFKLTRMDSVFTIKDDLNAAKEAFAVETS